MMKKLTSNIITFLFGALSFLIPLGIYFLTASKYIQPGDSTEMVTAAITLGVPHQPGYPLNTAIGHLFYKTNILGLDAVHKVNLTSSFLQALSVSFFYFLMLLIFKYIKINKGKKTDEPSGGDGIKNSNSYLSSDLDAVIPAFASSMFLAFSLIFWQYATKFEVFPLNNLFAMIILFLAFKIALSDGFSGFERLRIKTILWMILLSVVLGLAVTHHQTIVLIFPALLIILWPVIKSLFDIELKSGGQRSGKWKIIAIFLSNFLAVLIGVTVYFILILNFSRINPQMSGGIDGDFKKAAATLIRSEYGVFSPYLKTEGMTTVNYPFDQINYYLRSIWSDFSLYGMIFIFLGLFYLLKNNRTVFWFSVLGASLSGFLFLTYANFPLTDSFNQATARRFQILPDIFISVMAGTGLYYLVNTISQFARKGGSERNINAFYIVVLAVSFLPLYFNFKKADISSDDLTQNFINNSYASVPEGSLIMISGDIQNMTGEYFRLVQNPKTKTMIFTPGRFFLNWYLARLIDDNPQLSVPPPDPGKMFTTVTQIVAANYGKFPIYISPDLLAKDPHIEKDYTLYPSHLLYEVKKKGENIKLEDFRQENKKLFESLDMTKINAAKSRSPGFEESLIYYYARYFFGSGHVYSEVKLYDDAIIEYLRAIDLEPWLADSYQGISRAYANKENPDYVSAINYLSRYQQLIYSVDPQKAYDAQSTLKDYQARYENWYKKEMEKKQLEATQSGSLETASPSAK